MVSASLIPTTSLNVDSSSLIIFKRHPESFDMVMANADVHNFCSIYVCTECLNVTCHPLKDLKKGGK